MATITRGPGVDRDQRTRLPVPTRDRRPALAALALVLVLGGALASTLLVLRSGDRVEVLVAATDIAAGQTVGPDDLTTAQVAADGANFVLAEAESNFVGTTATVGIPAGTMINNVMFQTGTVVPAGADVVGLVLTAQQRPAEAVGQGDVVRLFLVPRGDQLSGEGAQGSELVSAARVVEAVDGGAQGLSVSVLVPADDAPAVVAGAATGQVAVTRLADDTEPVVDFATQD